MSSAVFRIFGEIAINNAKANKSITDTTSIAKKASKEINETFSKIGKAAVSCGKVIATGLAVGGAAIGALLKSTLGEYAEYEQLVGGVETLFKESKGRVMQYANEAYKTAGMSANEYMATVTSFSASLLQGLGGDTELAAEYANMAITDMADNANKMGTSMDSIQNAYQGFAKQNYTMLDNLKLGYGGTQAEMARLINDSGVLGSAVTVTAETVNQVPFDKVIKAIHIIQDEMGITGTTSKEAADTISGSFSTFKATWRNLLMGLAADDQNVNSLLSNFLNAGKTLAKNLISTLPTIGKNIKTILISVGQLVDNEMATNVWPKIQEWFKLKFDVELPDWTTITTAISTGFETYIKPVIEAVTTWFKENTESVFAVLKATGIVLVGMWIFVHPLATALIALGGAFALLNTDVDPANTTLTNIKSALEDMKKWFDENKNAVIAALAALGIAFLALNAPLALVIAFVAIVVANWEGLKAIIDKVSTAISDFFNKKLPDWWEDSVVTPIKNAWQGVVDTVNTAIEAVKTFLGLGRTPTELDKTIVTVEQSLGINNGSSVGTSSSGSEHGHGEGQSFAKGLDYVPYDDFPAYLHKGEAVLTATEAAVWRSGGMGNTGRLEVLMQQLLGVMNQVAANTGNGQTVVLDSGVLVGQMLPAIDTGLGSFTSRKGRRNG